MDSLLKLEFAPEDKKFQNIFEGINDTHSEELIIGLCGPIGTDIPFIAKSLKSIMEDTYNYNCKIIKLSEFIKNKFDDIDFTIYNSFEYYKKLIDCGNEFREEIGNSILAQLAINEITIVRENDKKSNGTDDFKSNRNCYIIDSIKNREELDLFRLIYRDIFYFIGVFSTIDNRKKNLEDKGMKIDEVFKLIDRDSGEEIANGQKVVDTFTEADLFMRLDKSSYITIEPKLKRFCNLIFSTNIVTPSPNEAAMYLAAAAAGNSACLSRQVGASITNSIGDIIAVGWNDVPKSDGGVYQYNEKDTIGYKDHRCMNLEGGICFNDKEKMLITELLVNELINNNLVALENKEKLTTLVRKSKIKELIEFSRSVHAEMLAIIIGSQKAGSEVRGGKLFCTTYPCHNCARHIVAAGIKEVYYIEPYRKSLAVKLHGDSITEEESKENKVKILMYEGISPKRYLEFFKMVPDSRKIDGKMISLKPKEIRPKNTLSLSAIPILEKQITKFLIDNKIININL